MAIYRTEHISKKGTDTTGEIFVKEYAKKTKFLFGIKIAEYSYENEMERTEVDLTGKDGKVANIGFNKQ